MAKLIRFRDFSDSFITEPITPGLTIAECIKIENWENYICLVNGKKTNENYIIQEDDYIIIRSIPHAATAALIIAGVAVAAGIAVGVYAGVQAYKAQQAAKAASEELRRLKNQVKDDVTNLPYLQGATNTTATGKTQPYIIGRNLFTPYILNGGNNYKGYHTIEGNYGANSFYNVVLEGGFNKQIIESLSCDDVKVASLYQETPQENTADFPRFYFNENSAFASNDSYIEIAQDGNVFSNYEFNKKIIEQELSDQLKKADADDYEDLYYTLEKNARACNICIMFNGLYARNSNGDKTNRAVTVIPEYSLDYAQKLADGAAVSGATWHTMTFNQPIYTEGHYETVQGVYQCEASCFAINWGVFWKNYVGAATLISGQDIRYDPNVVLSGSTEYLGSRNNHYYYRVTIVAKKTVWVEPNLSNNYSNTFNYNKSSQIRFALHQDFTFNDVFELSANGYVHHNYPITVRLRCTTNKVTSGSEISDCYVEWVQSECYNVEESLSSQTLINEKIINTKGAALSTLIGLHIKATTSNEDKIKKINIITNGIAPVPTYDEDTQLYTWDLESKSITSNPASWLVEVLTSDTHNASQVDSTELDLQTFGEFWTYCNEENITINKVLTKSQKKSEILDLILNVGHASLYQNIYGKIAVAFDSVKENALALFNEQNIISFEYEKAVSLEVDGVQATYIDADSNYQESSFVEMYDPDEEITSETVYRELSLEGITNRAQASKQVFYVMANDKLRPIKTTIKIGREGIFFTPYSKILLQHPALKIGLGNAVVKNLIVQDNNIIGVELYDSIGVSGTYQFSCVIQCVLSDGIGLLSKEIKVLLDDYLELSNNTNLALSDGTDLELLIAPGESTEVHQVYDLYFTEPISLDASVIPHRGDILSYGYELETVTRALTVMNIKPNGTQGYSLTCVDYDENIFNFDGSRIPEYAPIITERRTTLAETPSEVPTDSPTFEETQAIVSKITPAYLGIVTELPSTANEGDWFTWNGESEDYSTGKVYKYVDSVWTLVDEENSENGKELMTALKDILSLTQDGGYFSTVFSNALVSNSAFINKLAASIINLQQDSEGNGGLIKSDNYDGTIDSSGKITNTGNEGWAIDYTGNADFTKGNFSNIFVKGASRFLGQMGNICAALNNPILPEESGVYLIAIYKANLQGNPDSQIYTIQPIPVDTEFPPIIYTVNRNGWISGGVNYVTGDCSLSSTPEILTKEHIQEETLLHNLNYYRYKFNAAFDESLNPYYYTYLRLA